jgi:FKBP-type peptidyl-prolyl cis-trans isomerase 2
MQYRRLLVLLAVLAVVGAACSSTDRAAVDATTTTGANASDPSSVTTQAPKALGADAKIQGGDTVEVHYVGTLDDGSQFDSSRDRGAPFAFTVGISQVIPGFDAAIIGLMVGETVTARMVPADAYGEWSDDNIVEFPYDPTQDEVVVGDKVTLNNGQRAIVLEVSDTTVKVDGNHELAGQALTFEIEILSITRN